MKVTAVIRREGSWFVAQCLEVDVASQGETEDAALTNLCEALELYFEDAPRPEPAKVRTLELAIA